MEDSLIEDGSLIRYIAANETVLERLRDEFSTKADAFKRKSGSDMDTSPRMSPEEAHSLISTVSLETAELLQQPLPEEVMASYTHAPQILKSSLLAGAAFGSVCVMLFAYSGILTPETFPNTVVAGGTVVAGVFLEKYSSMRNKYNPKRKAITIREPRRMHAVGAIVHEACHAIQDAMIEFDYARFGAALEGHAMGVQRLIAEKHSLAEGNPAFLSKLIPRMAGELSSALENYASWQKELRILGILPAPTALKRRDMALRMYEVGTAAFQIAEAINGKDIYRSFLNRDFSFFQV